MKCGIILHGGAGNKMIGKRRLDLIKKALLEISSKSLSTLESGSTSIQAVQLAVNMMESNSLFNAGIGSVQTSKKTIEMDAGIMDGLTLKCGGVGAISKFKHPVDIAAKIMNHPHSLLVGKQAEVFAISKGFRRSKITTSKNKEKSDTVGAVAIDKKGRLSSAVSTGGMYGKLPGRVGDSAIVGAGYYADRNGAAVTTGNGDVILKTGMSVRVCRLLAQGITPSVSARKLLTELSKHKGGMCGIITIDKKGRYYTGHNTTVMANVSVFSGEKPKFTF